MYNLSESPQVNYSLSALSGALFLLMKTKSFEDITVTELCGTAKVSRKTFYRNCLTKSDLVDYAAEKQIRELLTTVDWSCQLHDVLFSNFFLFWSKRREFLSILCRRNLFSRFCEIFTRVCCDETEYPFLNRFLDNKENPDALRRFHHAFLIGGLCHILKEWTRERFKMSVEDLVSVTCYLAPSGVPLSGARSAHADQPLSPQTRNQ